ncbi:MAG: hypothetical protein K9M57_07940, partial [Phycisphaerae bacterium]|nr:hypothetical protein [Phycisphaerae bacterium]
KDAFGAVKTILLERGVDLPEQEEKKEEIPKKAESAFGKIAIFIGMVVFLSIISTLVLAITGGGGKNMGNAGKYIAAVVFLVLLPIIWKKKAFTVRCPECGKKLHGADEGMIGEIGVCDSCNAEFKI